MQSELTRRTLAGMNIPRLGSLMFAVAAALLCTLLAMQSGTGVTQQWFEGVHGLDEYTARLISQASWLRAIVAVDDVFVFAYTTAAVLTAIWLRPRSPVLSTVGLVLGVATGLLDLEENHHILAMLTAAQHGVAVSAASLEHRTVFSSMKWLWGPFGYCLLSLALPTTQRLSRVVQLTLWLFALPLTAAVLSIDDLAWLRPLAFVRLIVVVTAFVSLAVLMRRPLASEA